MTREILFLLCFLSACLLAMVITPLCLNLLKKLKAGQTILHYVDAHKSKEGTPTMGGIIFLLPMAIVGLLFIGNLTSMGSICIYVTLSYGLLGFLDDFIKIKNKQNEGLKAYQKIIGQAGIAIIVSLYCWKNASIGSSIVIPFLEKTINLQWWYLPLCMLAFIAMSNAVNLTDGLDGLVSKTSGVNIFVYCLIFYLIFDEACVQGDYFEQKNMQSMLFFATSLLGGIVGFAWVNSFPAKVFMGDTGSLALGGALCCCAVFIKNPLLLGLIGIMYILSCISVVVQVVYFKATKKRVFLMAPLHHHFEKKGIKESKIVSCYTIITIIFGIIALMSYFV